MFKQEDISAHVEDTFYRPIEVETIHYIDLADCVDILSAADVRELLGKSGSDSYHETHEEEL